MSDQSTRNGAPKPPEHLAQWADFAQAQPGEGEQALPQNSQAQPRPLPKKPVVFTAADWGLVALALVQALIWALVFSWDASAKVAIPMPAAGIPVITIASTIIVLIALGKKRHLNVKTILLYAACIAVSLTCALYSNASVHRLSALGIWALFTYTTFLTSGIWERGIIRAAALINSWLFFVKGLFEDAFKPWAALPHIKKGASKDKVASQKARNIIIGCVTAVVLLLIVLPLLAGADTVFGGFFTGIEDALAKIDLPSFGFDIVHFLLAVPPLFSLLWAISRRRVSPQVTGEKAKCALFRTFQPSAMMLVLAILDVVYLVFAVIQVRYLFLGTSSAALHGGYAAYARQGFFQLLAVAVINGIVVLFTATVVQSNGEKRRPLQVLNLVTIVLSAIILVSAVWRMTLYVNAYGLTIIRVMTYFFMAFVALMLVALIVKTFCTKISFFASFLTCAIVLWLAFACVNVDSLVATHNVDRYLDGTLKEVDVDYLGFLTYDAAPQIERLAQQAPDASVKTQATEALGYLWNNNYYDSDCNSPADVPWQYQCLSLWL